jgi:hypothetical protein
MGLHFLTESESKAGAKFQKSKHWVWSEVIDPSKPVKTVAFWDVVEREDEGEN